MKRTLLFLPMKLNSLKITAAALIFLLSSFQLKAQGNLPYVDDKPIHFGFSLGMNMMDFAAIPVDKNNDVSVTSLMPGFSVGAIVDLRLNSYFNLRFTPTLNLGQRTISYKDGSNTSIVSIPLYLPLYLKYSS